MNPPSKLNLAQFRKDAAFWDAERRKTYRGAGCPPIVYSFTPPFLFDCRLRTDRRMGIGDQLCLLSAIQAVADRVGLDNVRVWYDAEHSGSAAVFGMSGLPAFDPGSSAEYPVGHTIIPCRGHIMESAFGNVCPCLYGEEQGNPVEQILWGWGWHKLIGGHGVKLRLTPDGGAIKRAGEIAGQYAPLATCTPLEISRHNNDCNVSAWKHLLLLVNDAKTILFGCAPSERVQLSAMIEAMRLPCKTAIISEPLPVWKALVDLASENYTGNSCGMWLAFASITKTYLLQHETPEHRHNTMWNYKPKWDCKNIILVKT